MFLFISDDQSNVFHHSDSNKRGRRSLMPTSRKLSTTLYSDSSCQFRSVGRYTTVFVWVTKYFSSSKTTEVMSKLLGLSNPKKGKKMLKNLLKSLILIYQFYNIWLNMFASKHKCSPSILVFINQINQNSKISSARNVVKWDFLSHFSYTIKEYTWGIQLGSFTYSSTATSSLTDAVKDTLENILGHFFGELTLASERNLGRARNVRGKIPLEMVAFLGPKKCYVKSSYQDSVDWFCWYTIWQHLLRRIFVVRRIVSGI